jgi:hypothetical protein
MYIKTIIAALIFLASPSYAQNLVASPVDEASNDLSFLEYRTALIAAVEARDTEAVIALSDADISLSYGGDAGHAAFRDFLNVPIEKLSEDYKSKAEDLREEYWNELETVLKMGGRFQNDSFAAPYTWSAAYPKDADPYEVYFITGENVMLRAENNSTGRIISRLSYNVVTVPRWNPETDYQAIKLPNGQEGYLSSKYLRSLIDYRAFFGKFEGKWLMTVFIAGD